MSDSEEMQCNANNKTSDSSSSDSSSDIVNYSLEEFSRSGLFQRVFPLKSNIDYYSKFIEKPGEENTILWDYIKNSEQDL